MFSLMGSLKRRDTFLLSLCVAVPLRARVVFNFFLVEIIGNILSIVVETGASHSISVAIWGIIISQLGFYPLLIAGLSFIKKWSP